MTQAESWRRVGIALAFGSGYDLVFGVMILGFTRSAASILGLKVPSDPVYLHLNGVFLLILAGVYAAASREPERYRAIAPISAAGRTLGFLFFTWAWVDGRSTVFLALGAADLLIAAVTMLVWRRAVRLSD